MRMIPGALAKVMAMTMLMPEAPMVAMTCWKELQSGSLVEVLPGALPLPADFWAVYPAARQASAWSRLCQTWSTS